MIVSLGGILSRWPCLVLLHSEYVGDAKGLTSLISKKCRVNCSGLTRNADLCKEICVLLLSLLWLAIDLVNQLFLDISWNDCSFSLCIPGIVPEGTYELCSKTVRYPIVPGS